jgi:hypothetical protein
VEDWKITLLRMAARQDAKFDRNPIMLVADVTSASLIWDCRARSGGVKSKPVPTPAMI